MMKSNDGASSINWKRSRAYHKPVIVLWVLLISGLVGTWLLLVSAYTIFNAMLDPICYECYACLFRTRCKFKKSSSNMRKRCSSSLSNKRTFPDISIHKQVKDKIYVYASDKKPLAFVFDSVEQAARELTPERCSHLSDLEISQKKHKIHPSRYK